MDELRDPGRSPAGRGTGVVRSGFPRISERQYVDGSAKVVVTGAFSTCHGVTSYNPATGNMSKVDIEVTFTAKS